MKDQLFNLFGNMKELSLEEIALNIGMAALIGFFIFISYYLTHKGTIYSKKFNASLVAMTVLTGTVMTVIGNNIALSLGMVGALSIVRFRTAIKDSRDTIYLFWSVIVGICCGVGDFQVAGIGSAITFVVFLILGFIRNDNRMLIVIRASRAKQQEIQSLIYKTFERKAILRVRNTNQDNIEFIYEVSSKSLAKIEKKNIDIIDDIYKLGSVDYVNIVMQNDEISN